MDLASLLSNASALAPADAAHAYAAAGLRIFPCVPGAKRPLTRHGFHDATTDPDRITAWWAATPTANVGLATGPVGPAGVGVDVLDIDAHTGGSGYAGFELARRAGLVGSWAAMVRTPSGGAHAYYHADPGNQQGCWALGDAHVDFRGLGGYVLAPPSTLTVDDRTVAYQVIGRGRQPGSVDARRVHDLLRPPRRFEPSKTARHVAGHRDLDRLATWLSRRPEGSRNTGLYWAACRCAEAGVPAQRTSEALGDAARCAGLDTREIVATIDSAYRSHTADVAPTPLQWHPHAERGLSR